MTAAQKIAKEKFKKAIAIRQKTGVSLKEAFAEVYGKKKVGAVKKKTAKKVVKKAAPKKAAKKVVQKTKPRYSAKKHKNWSIIPEHKRRVNGLPKKKKVSEQSILNKIHKVKDEVSSLDELQHKHMIGSVSIMQKLKDNLKLIQDYEKQKENLKAALKLNPKAQPKFKNAAKTYIKTYTKLISELKTHSRELKKHI
jgi:hypothetical protein